MKTTILIVAGIAIAFVSFIIGGIRVTPEKPTELTVKAKLKIIDSIPGTLFRPGSMYVKSISSMLNEGDTLSMCNHRVVIIKMDRPKLFTHIEFPEEIRGVSDNMLAPTILRAYQHNDTLEISF